MSVARSSRCGISLTPDAVHPVAAQGFAATVDAYRRSRPSYPPEAVVWLVDALRIVPGSTVVDVGAGTGMFSTLLAATGAAVIAIEPLDSMRAVLVAEMPGIKALAGTAEQMPLDDGAADSAVAAQAFHWFALDQALHEFHRVLRPGGRLGVIWNDLDTSTDWVSQFDRIISVPRVGTPHPSAAGSAELAPLFGAPHRGRFEHSRIHDRDSLLDRVNSMSFVAVQPEQERAAILDRVARLLDTHPQLAGHERFELPYVTKTFWTERREL